MRSDVFDCGVEGGEGGGAVVGIVLEMKKSDRCVAAGVAVKMRIAVPQIGAVQCRSRKRPGAPTFQRVGDFIAIQTVVIARQ